MTNVTSNTLNLNQFSFSDYDDSGRHYAGVTIGEQQGARRYYDGNYEFLMAEPNITDRPWYNTQTEQLVKFYEELLSHYPDWIELSVEPNYYGSVFLAWSCPANHEDDLNDIIIDLFDNENISYHKHMPLEYEEFIMAHFYLNDPADHGILDDDEYRNSCTEFLNLMEHYTRTAGYDWTNEDRSEWREYWMTETDQEVA